jgi:hypothetical protein
LILKGLFFVTGHRALGGHAPPDQYHAYHRLAAQLGIGGYRKIAAALAD